MSRRWQKSDLLKATGKRNKYNARKKVIDGVEFDSTKEARRYQDLVLMQKAGQISDLRRQMKFSIYLKAAFICDWIADFVYLQDGARVVEDCKGFKTEIYRLKKKLVQAEYNIKILET